MNRKASLIHQRMIKGADGFYLRPGRKITEELVAVLAEATLSWAQDTLEQKAGPNAGEIAGFALYKALSEFDPSRGVPLRPYLRQHLYWIARNELKKLGLWTGTARYERERGMRSLDDPGLPAGRSRDVGEALGIALLSEQNPGGDLERREQTVRALKQMNEIQNSKDKMVAFGKFLIGMQAQELRQALKFPKPKPVPDATGESAE